MLEMLELVAGLVIWLIALWDSFATIVLPRTVAPMCRPSGRFNKLSWRLWAAVGRRITQPQLQLSFLAIYGPVSVILLLILWAGLMILAFALIYQGLGTQFVATSGGSVGFGTLVYTSASTFLTLGLGDVTSPEPIGRFLVIMEAASGFIFLGLMISYMPLLDQAYRRGKSATSSSSREPAGPRAASSSSCDTRKTAAPRSFAEPCARRNDGWPRSSRAIFLIRCSLFTGRSVSINRGSFR